MKEGCEGRKEICISFVRGLTNDLFYFDILVN